jgi:hypothetical protein
VFLLFWCPSRSAADAPEIVGHVHRRVGVSVCPPLRDLLDLLLSAGQSQRISDDVSPGSTFFHQAVSEVFDFAARTGISGELLGTVSKPSPLRTTHQPGDAVDQRRHGTVSSS